MGWFREFVPRSPRTVRPLTHHGSETAGFGLPVSVTNSGLGRLLSRDEGRDGSASDHSGGCEMSVAVIRRSLFDVWLRRRD